MDFWQKARTFAEEAAKRSQELTKEAAKKSQELTIGSSKISDIVSETAKRSMEIAAEATKKADQIKVEALKRADQIKSLAEGISPQIPVPAISLIDSSSADTSSSDLEKFGVTDDLREFVKGITLGTFQDFPMEDEPETADVLTVSNVRQDLTEWQARHATLVLSTVKEISRLRYDLCPRLMKEKKFWRIYFVLVNSHVAPYEKRYMEEVKLKGLEQGQQAKDDKAKDISPVGTTSKQDKTETNRPNKASSSTEQDLDVFLLGDLGSSDEGPDDGDETFDDDFDKIDNSDEEDEKQLKKTTSTAG
ncbi:uncharacterized protein LOC122653147 isoform X1 [Telopea speciosissima]|uniref:uncharacterized protein LOC122653147 isoform X1 n=2 Tax=Telopea speciosissima TaxID=54955 RepID=UPI001CC5E7F4|nr:uncharacterized protein LOC122653147 isoform X1 [Telopea speciosissima]